MSSDLFFGVLGVIFATVIPLIYIRSILRRESKPHIYSQSIWAITLSVAFVGQLVSHAGLNTLTLSIIASTTALQALLSVRYGTRDRTMSDVIFLILALSIFPLWILTKNAELAIVLGTAIDICGYFPTIRKTWRRPRTESLLTWQLVVCRDICMLAALTSFNILSAFYIVAISLFDCATLGVILWRRFVLKIRVKN